MTDEHQQREEVLEDLLDTFFKNVSFTLDAIVEATKLAQQQLAELTALRHGEVGQQQRDGGEPK